MMKKVISTILALMMLISTMVTVSADDIDGHEYESSIRLLSGLRIMEGDGNGIYRPDDSIIRAEFAALMTRVAGLDGVSEGYMGLDGGFSDVTKDDWFYGYANMVRDLGYMEGYDNNIFGGRDNVTLNQAIKTVVCVLGYGDIAEDIGGYPLGYINQAGTLDLLDGITFGDDAATRGEIACLIDNALNCATAVKSVGSQGGIAYDGETLLSKHDCEYKEGIVEAVYGMTDGSVDGVGVDDVRIGGTTYKSAYGDMSTFFGREVRFWVKDIDGTKTVIYVESTDRSKQIEVKSEDISSRTDLTTFEYYDSNRNIKSVSLNNITIIYNGKQLSTLDTTAEALKPKNGSVVLTGEKRGSGYDTAVVWEYETVVMNSTYDNIIYGKYGNSVNINENVSDSVQIYIEGQLADVSAIKTNDVLSVYASKDGLYKRIVVSRATKEGVVESSGEKNGIGYYNLQDGSVLYSSKEYNALIQSGDSRIDKPAFGGNTLFYLDNEGRIASSENVDGASSDYPYAYIIEAVPDNSGEEVHIKYMGMDNAFHIAQLDSKVRLGYVSGGSYSTGRVRPNDVYNALIDPETNQPKRQICKIDVDGEIIKAIYLNDTTNSGSVWGSCNIESTMRTYAGRLLGHDYIVDEDTFAFYVPVANDESKFKAGLAMSMMTDNYSYRTYLYDIDNMHVDCVVIAPGTSASNGFEYVIDIVNSPYMMIESLSEIVDADGEVKTMMEGWVDGKKKSVVVGDELELNSDDRSWLRSGVMIQYLMNTAIQSRAETSDEPSEMILFNMVYDFTGVLTEEILWDRLPLKQENAKSRTLVGTIERAELPKLIVKVDGTSYPVVVSDYAKVLEMNTDDYTCTIAPVEALTQGQKVFIRQRYNNTRDIIIIK